MKKTVIILSAAFSLSASGAVAQEGLDMKQEKIAAIAANTATGNLTALKAELGAGLDAGLTVNEIKEVLVQMYAYCGFPRSLQGLNTFMAVTEERKNAGITDEEGREASPVSDGRDKYSRGREILEKLTMVPQTDISGANAFAPAIDVFLKEHLFADIFERDILTYQQRELATISALAAMEGVEPMLRSHIGMGLNTGLTEKQLEDAMSVVGKAVNIGRETAGRSILKEVVKGKN